MISYIIFPNEGGIACKRITTSGDSTFLVTKDEFNKMVSQFTNRNYKVKLGSQSIFLYGKDTKITISEYEKIIEHPYLVVLKESIEDTIRKEGFSTLQNRSKVNSKPNRDKSNRNSGKRITKASKYLIILLFALNVLNSSIGTVYAPRQPENTISNSDVESIGSPTTYHFEDTIKYALPNIQTPKREKTDGMDDGNAEKEMKLSEGEIVVEIPPEIDTGYIEFEDLSETDKAISTKTSYYDIMCECASLYGLDEDMILGIAIQERGIHSSTIDDGGGLGLMQIQYEVWINEELDYYEYNPQTGNFEYRKMVVTDEIMRNMESNLHTGAKILQKCLRMAKYNIPVAIQMYNQGYGSIKSIITTYATERGITYDDVIANPEDLGWMDYRHLKPGDPKYIENVNKWISENTFKIIHVEDQSTVEFAFENTSEEPSNMTMN